MNAAVGFLAKTGRAFAVVLRGPADSPALISSCEVSLWPGHFSKEGPYHTVMELPWEEAVAKVAPVESAVEAMASDALARLLAAPEVASLHAAGVGVVGSAASDPSRIGNPHIRAHAAEGQLFRAVLERAAARRGLRCMTFPAKDAFSPAAKACGAPKAAFQARVRRLGAGTKPWRLEQQCAAAAAWAVLCSR